MTTALALWFVFSVAIAAYVGLAVIAVGAGARAWWFLAAAPVVVALVPLAVASFHCTLAWIFRAPRPPEHRIGMAAAARLLVHEALAILVSWPRMALFRWCMRELPPTLAGVPVLLLHGVLCNAGVWQRVRTHLVARGIARVYALTFAPPVGSIEDFADQVASRVDAILAETGAQRLALVGHSMGGLVARAYLRRYGAEKIALTMTLGTPHHGSVHAWLFAGAALAQMRPGNAWLAELNRTEGASCPVRFVSLWSWHDSMVAPQTSSRLAGAVDIELDGIGHNALLDDARVFECMARELAGLQAQTPGS
jgi:triacylglycerol esterase/lipase EstA (alpha/beta hydrolase family)